MRARSKKNSLRTILGATNMPDPLYQAFLIQRRNANMRKIPWHFEYWEWLQLWQESGHLHERGVKKGDWVMARNGDKGAYERANVKITRCESNLEYAVRNKAKIRRPHAFAGHGEEA